MLEVTKDGFFRVIYREKLDVVVSVEDPYDYPFTTLFKFRNGELWGKIVDEYANGTSGLTKSKFYINQ